MNRIFLSILCVLTLASCKKISQSKDEYLAAMDDSIQTESLIFWTSDTAYSTNPELMLLLDTLYQHVRADEFPLSAKEEEKWMKAYRLRLCSYYDSHEKDFENMTEYEKASYILDEGTRLVELDGDDSTMGMIVKNSTIYTFDVMREYCLLSRVLGKCNSVETLELFYKEHDLYTQMSKLMASIAVGLARINFWGGSIVGPISTERNLGIIKSRLDMYKTILDITSKDSWESTGVFIENAQQLLLDCSVKAVEDYSSDMREYLNDEENEEELERYDETVNDTKEAVEELRPLLKEWGILWNNIDEDMTHDGNRHEMERAASNMLVKWASMVCSRW